GLCRDEEMVDVLGENEYLGNSLEKDGRERRDEGVLEMYEGLGGGEPGTVENGKSVVYCRLLDGKGYELGRVGG
ncbi:hypothetical protein, partial [Staphylococcus saprophyticus]|uniref:hypothetical protein n=1 Tax=Staphylococcus saprophyticus TaxID=29385 RepID=UPI001642E506